MPERGCPDFLRFLAARDVGLRRSRHGVPAEVSAAIRRRGAEAGSLNSLGTIEGQALTDGAGETATNGGGRAGCRIGVTGLTGAPTAADVGFVARSAALHPPAPAAKGGAVFARGRAKCRFW